MGAAPSQDGEEEGQVRKTYYFDGFKGAVPLFTYKKDGEAKSGYLDGIFGGFGDLRGSPGVIDE